MRLAYAKQLLEKVRDDYNKIANSFNRTRNYIPSDLLMLKKYVLSEDVILDLGCGNGRLFEVLGNITDYYGVDISQENIEIARQRYPEAKLSVIEPLSLPFRNDFFDKVFCLSVFHHIPSKRYRLQFLKEIKRVLKPGGFLILTVWNLFPKRKIHRLLLKYTILKLIGKSKLDFGDIFLSWKDSESKVVIDRYIHVFSMGELKRVFKRAGFDIQESKIIQRSQRESNIFVLAKKPL